MSLFDITPAGMFADAVEIAGEKAGEHAYRIPATSKTPRKTLQYQTPAEKFAECVAAID